MGVQTDAIRAAYPALSIAQRRVLRTLIEHGEWQRSFWNLHTITALERHGLIETREHQWRTARGWKTNGWEVRITADGKKVLGDE